MVGEVNLSSFLRDEDSGNRLRVQGFIFLRVGTRPALTIVFAVHRVFRRGNPLWLPDAVFGIKLAIAWKNKN